MHRREGLRVQGLKPAWIIPGFMCQGGDFTTTTALAAAASMDPSSDENFQLMHTGPGVLSINSAEHERLAFLCTARTDWLDGKHVVLGKVISGYDEV